VTETTPTPGPDVARRRSARRWLIIGGIAVVFLLIIGYVIGGAAAASGPVARADTALHTAVSHNNVMVDSFNNDPFKGIDLKSDNPDIPAAKTAVATVKQGLAKWQAQVSSDRTALQNVRSDLKGSLLTLPEQGTLDRHRQRVDAALSATEPTPLPTPPIMPTGMSAARSKGEMRGSGPSRWLRVIKGGKK